MTSRRFLKMPRFVTRTAASCRGKIPIVVDARANSSVWFARSFQAAWSEQWNLKPRNSKIWRANTAALGNVTVLEEALGATQGKVDLRDVGEAPGH
jgi:hypothetical protein